MTGGAGASEETGGMYGLLILVAAFCCGLMSAANRQQDIVADRTVTDTLTDTVIGRTGRSAFVTFPGIVCDATASFAGTIRSITVCISGTRRPKRVRITFRTGSLPAAGIHTGDRVLITGRPEQPRPPENPFGFDERRWLTSLGVHATVDDPARIRLVHDHSSIRSRARFIRERLRSRIHTRFEHQRHAALASAVLLGDRSEVDRWISDRFIRSGLMHLLALSGLHVGVIGGIVYLIIDSSLRRLGSSSRMRRLSRTVLWTIVMGAYATVVGWPVSVVRALVMAGGFLAVSTAGRRCSPWQVFGLAAATLLIVSPAHLYDAGFQLSFSAVGGLILVRPEKDPHPALLSDQSDAVRSLIQAVRASVSAGVATMPVLLFHFGSAPTAGVLLSPPGIMLMGPLLVATMLTLVLPAGMAAPLVHAAGAGFDALITLGGADPTWLPELTHVPGRWSTRLVLPILVGGALWTGGGRRRLGLLITTTVAASMLLGAEAVTSRRGPEHTIVFFSVGQGDAALVHSASGHAMLIDAAPGAVRPVRRYLEATGIERIHTVVLTHSHIDHTGGLTDLGRQVPLDRLVHTGWIRSAGTVIDRVVTAGDTLGLGSGMRVDILGPDEIRDSHGNNDSIILRVRIGRIRVLFMGDAESAAETRLVSRFSRILDAEIVKAGHHGSNTSSSDRFVDSTHPRIVILSAGRHNRFGHPSPLVVERWSSIGADVHVTATGGALVLTTNGLDVRVRKF